MLRRVIGFLMVLIFIASCNKFSSKSTTSKGNLQVLDSVIDFTKVDVYPIFTDCENYAENDNQKACFESTIIQKLSGLLRNHDVKVSDRVNDTTYIDILIDNTGKASIKTIESPESIKTHFQKFDSIIKQSVSELPSVKPAVKRGIFVNSQYRLAVIVTTI